MTIVQQLPTVFLLMAGVGGGKIVHPKEAPPLGPKYSYMGHVLFSLALCTVINDQPNPGRPKLMIS